MREQNKTQIYGIGLKKQNKMREHRERLITMKK